MFPNRDGTKPITLRWADRILRASVEKANLTAKGISTHSTRRSFITKLHRNGADLYTIKQITGHQDFKSLERYVEISADSMTMLGPNPMRQADRSDRPYGTNHSMEDGGHEEIG
jgi:site-specific recombinase XerD